MIVSIITINYNNAIGLKKTIESVIRQNCKNIEFIVIDGNSNDGSKEVIIEHQSNINSWVSESDNGIYQAMNKGIEKANGDYLLFLNSGDFLYDQNVIQSVINKKITSDIAYGNMIIDYGNKQETGIMPNTIKFEQMFFDTLWHPVSFIKKNLFQKYGKYDERFKIVGDYEWFFKVIVNHGIELIHLQETISVYNMEGISSSQENTEKIKLERQKVWEMHLPKIIIQHMLDQKDIKDQNSVKNSIFTRIINKIK